MGDVVKLKPEDGNQEQNLTLNQKVAKVILLGQSIHEGSWDEETARTLEELEKNNEDPDPDWDVCYNVSLIKATKVAAETVGIPELGAFLALVNHGSDVEVWAVRELFPSTNDICDRLLQYMQDAGEEDTFKFSIPDFCELCDPGCYDSETEKIHGAVSPYCWATQLGDVIADGTEGVDVAVGQFWVSVIREREED